MRGFGRALLWRAAGINPVPALSGARLKEWLRQPGRISPAARAAAAFLAALLAIVALFAAIGLRSGGVSAWTGSLLALPQGRIVPPADNRNFDWIERAIAQCEAEAAQSRHSVFSGHPGYRRRGR
jgi:hypothetical protein